MPNASRPLWQLTVSDSFSAAHALRHYQGKCERLHGHNFTVDVTVEGEQLEADTEMLLDFTVIKGHLKAALAGLDHRELNATPPFDRQNPSSENLARHIYRLMAAALGTGPVRLVSVRVAEKPGQSATYRELARQG